jgi:hypothetical protein
VSFILVHGRQRQERGNDTGYASADYEAHNSDHSYANQRAHFPSLGPLSRLTVNRMAIGGPVAASPPVSDTPHPGWRIDFSNIVTTPFQLDASANAPCTKTEVMRCAAYAGERRSITVDFDDRFGEGLRGFLRQVVTDALDDPVRSPENFLA